MLDMRLSTTEPRLGAADSESGPLSDFDDLIAQSEHWTPEARAQLAESLEAVIRGELRAWFCKRGRSCDGKPHEGYSYPHARGDQWPPPGEDWFVWLLSGGRGSGKTRTGAEYTRRVSEHVPRIGLIAPTGADLRDTIVEGESGLKFVYAMAGEKIHYEPSKRRVTFPSGCIATLYSAEEPDRLRGSNNGFLWMDEPAHYEDPQAVWNMATLGLRIGRRPHICMTTTPLPSKFIKARIKDPRTRTVRVSTYKNLENLAPNFRDEVLAQFEGTRLGLQELHGKVLREVDGAKWEERFIQHDRTVDWHDMERIVVAIDPAGTANRRSDETGIVVVGRIGKTLYVLEDASGKYSPNGWAQKAIDLYDRYEADVILAERNFGADMVKNTIMNLGFEGRVIEAHAQRSKELRADPIVAKYEQGLVWHVGDTADLEDEMLTWIPGKGDSPNRVDALVWGLTEVSDAASSMTLRGPSGTIIRNRTAWNSGTATRSPLR